MGLLDEAIREHLELKRRHGADPSEVQRLEGEALSPARAQAPAEPAEAHPEAPAAHPEAPATHHDDAPAPAPVVHEAPSPPTRVVGGAVSMDAYLVDHPEPQTRATQPGPEPRDEVDHPERTPEAHPAPHGEVPEDVLEETPEFLQETPEHERLWFEQKPPKDFDF